MGTLLVDNIKGADGGNIKTFAADEITNASNLTLNVGGDINLDADGGDVVFQDGGTDIMKISNDTQVVLSGEASNQDIQIRVNDGGTEVTCVHFDAADGGLVGIGTTDPSNRFTLHDDAASSGAGLMRSTSGTFAATVVDLFADRNTTNGTYNYMQMTCTSVQTRCQIRDSGDLRNVNNTYGAISDQNLKENIVDAASQWNDIKNLKVRKFNYKSSTGGDTSTKLGLIAQEAALVSPGLVDETTWTVGGKEGTYKSIKYSVLYMKAVKGLQEAINRIESLESEITSLKSRVTTLESS